MTLFKILRVVKIRSRYQVSFSCVELSTVVWRREGKRGVDISSRCLYLGTGARYQFPVIPEEENHNSPFNRSLGWPWGRLWFCGEEKNRCNLLWIKLNITYYCTASLTKGHTLTADYDRIQNLLPLKFCLNRHVPFDTPPVKMSS
jgi:hypothetical protein